MKTTNMNKKLVGAVVAMVFGLALSLSSQVAEAQMTWSTAVKTGTAEPAPWPGQWWGYRSNGIAVYKGAPGGTDLVSPAEKLDKAVGRGTKIEKDKLGTWLTCALKAWEPCRSKSGKERSDCVNKSEYYTAYNACSKGFTVDTAHEWETAGEHGLGNYGWDTWWGHCPGWAATAILYKEPIKSVTWSGQTFRIGDVKALLAELGESVDLTADGWNCSRTNEDEELPGATDKAAYKDCTPLQYMTTFTKYLGGLKHGVAIDRYTGGEVWNQPVKNFSTSCSPGGSGCPAGETANTCSTSFTWGEDGVGWDDTTATAGSSGYTTRTLSFVACVKNDQMTSSSAWNVSNSVPKSERWPDFIWVPSAFGATNERSNPYVWSERQKIIDNLQKPASVSGGGGGGTPTYTLIKSYKKTVNKAIPDNNATGASGDVRSYSTATIKAAELCVDISHTYRGDLEVSISNGTVSSKIWDNQGGSTDDIKECLAVTGFNGLKANKKYTVKVVDTASTDTGTFKSFELKLYR
ncbi:MAG: proprotein convertase P-domain-containing protein [Deltaproteobacteria bacterium]|nr:proprotein convertase P-domain-containing protein [Deltaproteobacteria bacterium]